ncbi:methyl-accepting chemotaxis protein [Anaerosporobacter sp.]
MKVKKKIRKISIFQSIQGKIIELGSIAFIGILILGFVGLYGITETIKNSNMEAKISEINQLQGKNEAADSLYIYYIDESYLNTITENLEQMKSLASGIEKSIDKKYESDMNAIMTNIEQRLKNYQEIIPLNSERGFDESQGLYAQYKTSADSVQSQLTQLMNENTWADTNWSEISGEGKTVTIGNKEYIKVTYSSKLPQVGKRDVLAIRIGGTAQQYKKNIYINNIYLKKGSTENKMDLSTITEADLSNSYGDALQGLSLKSFNGKEAIHVKANFTAANNRWEEICVKLPISSAQSQEYDMVYYDLYMEVPIANELQAGGAVTDIFNFSNEHNTLINEVNQYSKLVNEGKEVDEIKSSIETRFKTIEDNLVVYSSNEELNQQILENLNVEKDSFSKMQEIDTTILQLKKENTELSNELTTVSTSFKSAINKDMKSVQSQVTTLILVVLAVTAISIVVITFFIGKGIRSSIVGFKKLLAQITEGNIDVRADVRKNDEFSQFGKSLNMFLDRLSEVVGSLQKVSQTLIQSGEVMEERANQTYGVADTITSALNDISQGAAAQAEDVNISSGEISVMGDNINQIIEKVNHLSQTAVEMKEKGDESVDVMQELGESNQRTTTAFDKIATQIKVTDDSVHQIRDAINLITSIAEQTNLLSLNASIEAARAGEAGKGFAVVATEIQKLAEQCNSSAKIIDDIITELTKESQTTVQYVEQITAIVEEQKEKLQETNKRFLEVSAGIQSSSESMKDIIAQANDCNTSREKTIEVITNLSAISEENAASTEQTNSSMQELNEATKVLADTASELKELSVELQKDLSYFKV